MADITLQGSYESVLDMLERAKDSYFVIGFAGADRSFVKLYLSTSLDGMSKADSMRAEKEFRRFFNDDSLLRFSGRFKEIYGSNYKSW